MAAAAKAATGRSTAKVAGPSIMAFSEVHHPIEPVPTAPPFVTLLKPLIGNIGTVAAEMKAKIDRLLQL